MSLTAELAAQVCVRAGCGYDVAVATELPAPLEHFVLEHLRSLEHLEALLALQQDPTRWWSGEALALELGTSARTAERILEDLCSANLLNVTIASAVSYQFSPGSPEMAARVADLVEALRHARVRVYTLITSRSTRALQDFADAFRFRGPKRG